jgi:hypothetical protein
MVLDSAGVVLNFWDMLVLSAEVEWNVRDDFLQGLKFWVSENGRNAEAMAVKQLEHFFKGVGDIEHLPICEVLASPNVQFARDGEQEWNFIHEHDIHS